MSSQTDLTKAARADTSSSDSSGPTNKVVTNWKSIYIIVALCMINALTMTMITVNSWPYLKDMDDGASQQFFGICKTLATVAGISASLLTGWLANRFSDTKQIILVGIILDIITSLSYANIEILSVNMRKWAFLLTEVGFSVSIAAISTWRAYIPMASRPEDRQRAFGLINVSINAGLIISPFIVIPFGKLFANSSSIDFPWGSRLNIFTTPVYIVALLSSLIGIIVGLFFDGKFQIVQTAGKAGGGGEEEGTKNEKKRWSRSDSISKLTAENGPTNSMVNNDDSCSSATASDLQQIGRPDWLAVGCCFLVRFVVTSYYVYLFSLASSFTMATFGWTGEQTVSYSTAAQGALGTIALLISVGFSTRFLSRLAPERFFVLFSLSMMLLFFLLTFPWPFLTARMPHCDVAIYRWCQNAPAVNVYLYHIAYVACMGLSLPIVFQNLDVLYSRILGPIKQGTLQAAFNSIGSITLLFGPALINFAYQNYGPTPIWSTYVCLLSAATLLWLFNYRRMVPKDGANNKS